MKKKNSYIELLRFIFAFILLLHHTGNFGVVEKLNACPTGFIVVEFFYILIGCFAMKRIEDNLNNIDKPMQYGMTYTVNKLKRLFPYAAISTVVCYFWFITTSRDIAGGLKQYFWGIWNMFYEMFFLTFTGSFQGEAAYFKNAPLWFLAGLLIALPLVMYLAVKARDFFKGYFVWFAPWMLYGWMVRRFATIGIWDQYEGMFYGGVIRAFAGITLGCSVYLAAKKISEYEKFKVVLAIAEILGILVVIYTCTTFSDAYLVITVVMIMAISIAISMSGVTFTGKIKSKIIDFLGTISMPMFCLHWPIQQIINDKMGEAHPDNKAICFLIVTIVVAILVYLVIEYIGKKLRKSN